MVDEPNKTPEESTTEEEKGTENYRWMEKPATHCDHAVVGVFNGIVRIAFADWLGPDAPPIFRTSVAMTLPDARDFIQLMQKEISEYEKRRAERRQRSQQRAEGLKEKEQ